MESDAPLAKLEVWAMNAPAVKNDPDLMFALCSVEPSSTANKLMLKQKEPPTNEVYHHNSGPFPAVFSLAAGGYTSPPCALCC